MLREAARAPVPVGPTDKLIKRDRRRVDQPQHLAAFALQCPVGKPGKPLESFSEDRNRTPGIGVRQCRARKLADPQMVVMMRIGVPDRLKGPQAINAAELRKHQRDQVIPASEHLVVGIAVVPFHCSRKLTTADRFQQPSKNAIAKPHARSLSESRQPESTCFTQVKPGMLRDTVNHSPDSPAKSGER